MGIYDKNIEAIRQADKNVETLNRIDSNILGQLGEACETDPGYIRVLKSPMGHQVMFVKNNEGNFIQMNSMYDPYEEAQYLCRDIQKDFFRRLIVVIGVGMGYHLREIGKRLNEKSIVIVVEKDVNILASMLRHEDFSDDIDLNKFIFICGNLEDVGKKIKTLVTSATYNLKNINIITLPILELEYIKYCKEIVRIIEKSRVNHMFNMGNDTEDTLTGIINNFTNMHEMLWNCGLAEFLEIYNDEYKGKPAIVVASGPSLSKNIHLLKDIQNKVLIVACDGAMKPLLANGVIPDAVLSVERIWLTYEWFYKDKEIPKDTVLIAPPVIRPEIFDRFADNRKIISFKKGEGVNEWMAKSVKNKGGLPTGSSVAHLCFSFANAVGADPIVLIGQDLAYSPDGSTHGSGVEGGKKVEFGRENVVYVKDYNGNDIPSTSVWKNFLTQLENYIGNSAAKCIDATEGGARIDGTEIMTLKDVIAQYCKDELPPLYTIVEKYRSNRLQVLESYRNLVKQTKKEIKWFELLKLRVDRAREITREIEENYEIYSSTDEGLNKMFDAVLYVEYKLAKKVKTRLMYKMMFQTPLREIAFEVSDLGAGVKELTAEVLMENIKIQNKLIKIVDLITKRTIETLEAALKIAEDDLNALNDECRNLRGE